MGEFSTFFTSLKLNNEKFERHIITNIYPETSVYKFLYLHSPGKNDFHHSRLGRIEGKQTKDTFRPINKANFPNKCMHTIYKLLCTFTHLLYSCILRDRCGTETGRSIDNLTWIFNVVSSGSLAKLKSRSLNW